MGTAVPDRLQNFRVRLMQDIGVNAWRMSHNPPNVELLDALDRAGMLVMDESRNFGNFSQWYKDWADLIRRDRNHPRSACWLLVSVTQHVLCWVGLFLK